MDIKINNNRVTVDSGNGEFYLSFHRTLRIPDDGNRYPLPASLGRFPIRRVEDYADKLPADWVARGGVLIPMHYIEALWVHFESSNRYQYAVKVGVGNINVISGMDLIDSLLTGADHMQDYLVAPNQPWLDGLKTQKDDSVRQFVAVYAGDGKSVEHQLRGEDKYGGMQFLIYKPKYNKQQLFRNTYSSFITMDSTLEKSPLGEWNYTGNTPTVTYSSSNIKGIGSRSVSRSIDSEKSFIVGESGPDVLMAAAFSERTETTHETMAIGAGGTITQKIYPDSYGVDTWDQKDIGRLFVNIVSAKTWYQLTGEILPTPINQEHYKSHHIPFFHLKDQYDKDVAFWEKMGELKSVATIAKENNEIVPDNKSFKVGDHAVTQKKW